MASNACILCLPPYQAFVKCTWQLSLEQSSTVTKFQTYDLSLERCAAPQGTPMANGEVPESSPHLVGSSIDGKERSSIGRQHCHTEGILDFLLQAIGKRAASNAEGITHYKVVTVKQSGFVLRSDILSFRMVDAEHLGKAFNFPEPRGRLDPLEGPAEGPDGLLKLLAASVGAFSIDEEAISEYGLSAVSAAVEKDIENRLNLQFLMDQQPPQKRMFLYEGRPEPIYGDLLYKAAKAMDVKLVVMDIEGHWVQDKKYDDIREAFIVTPYFPMEDLTERIVATVKAYGKPFDGLMTYTEPFYPMVAEAAKQLGVPFSSPQGLATAIDKHAMRIRNGLPALRVAKVEDLDLVEKDERFQYPLILKPCLGWNSEGASISSTKDELVAAYKRINPNRHGVEAVIENYCDGPECNTQLLLDDGKVRLFDSSDDLTNDDTREGPTTSSWHFLETNVPAPSALPENELKIVEEAMHKVCLDLGFTDGVYHLEARMRNSSMEWRKADDGIYDFFPRDLAQADKQSPSAFLLEVNPRPPGPRATRICHHMLGLDYPGLSMLYHIGDKERGRAMATKYANGVSAYYEMAHICALKGGTFQSDDICEELLLRRPDLAKSVAHSHCSYWRGRRVPPPEEELVYLATFIVRSRKSRHDARRIATEVQKEVRFKIA